MKNLFDEVYLDAEQIERCLQSYTLETGGAAAERKDLPIFVHSFYKFIEQTGIVPTQRQFYEYYRNENRAAFNRLRVGDEDEAGIVARAFRAYPSIVRDVHFGALLKDEIAIEGVFYNTIFDVEYGIDLAVKCCGVWAGLALFTDTRYGRITRHEKSFITRKNTKIEVIEYPINLNKCKKCGEFYLYSGDDSMRVVDLINNKGEY